MRIGLGQFNEITEEKLKFIKQLGADDFLLNTPRLPGDERWEFRDLLLLRTTAEDSGLRLAALENTPVKFYDQVMLGGRGRDRQIDNMAVTIRNMGRAGIPILGYHWMPNQVWRTSRTTPARGGATVTSFDLELAKNAPPSHDREYTADELRANHDYYMKAILPVCEEAGVAMALHPDDPPVDSLGGVARIMNSFEGFRRAMETVPSARHGLDF
jgi:mannonate dehydratase